MRPSDDSPRQGASGMRHKTFFASIVRFPDRHGPIPPGSSRGRSTRFAAAMARVRRPVPFRTRKLRPCTAMVLHPRGCGRVARRRFHTIRFPPVEPSWAPGGFLFFPTHARAGGPDDAARTPGDAGPSLPHICIFIHPFVPPFPLPSSFLFLRSSPRFFSSFPLLSCPSFLSFPTSPAFLRPRPATSLLSFLRHRLFPSPAASPRFLFALPGDSRIPAFCLFRSSSAIIGFWNSL